MNNQNDRDIDPAELASIMERARSVARDYYLLTGRPLGVTAEIGEYDAARLLGYELAAVREAGYDAVRPDGLKSQVKTRCLTPAQENGRRVPAIKMTHDWDIATLVLLDEEFRARAIYEAPRAAVAAEIARPGDKARARGALNLKAFKNIATLVWSRDQPDATAA